MNKAYVRNLTLLITFSIGLFIFLLSNLLRDFLTDFVKGFCEGCSIVFILIGFIYISWCLVNKKNPFILKR